ncbi:hypothetical protein TcCL_Unassigned04999, partial [Trypanosoma cruzi]
KTMPVLHVPLSCADGRTPPRLMHHMPRSWVCRSGQRQAASVCALRGTAGEKKGYVDDVSRQVIQNRRRVLACFHDSTRRRIDARCRGNSLGEYRTLRANTTPLCACCGA